MQKKNIVLTVVLAVIFAVSSEMICLLYGQHVPRADFRMVYLLAFMEPVLSAIILVPWFFILKNRLILSRTALRDRNGQLQEALSESRQMRGMLPICPVCKKVRDDAGYWRRIETFVETHSKARFTHSMCDECARRLEEEGDER